MVCSWCTRYEAKHNYFKRLASNLGNFTIVAVSLAEHHQTRICYLMSSQNGETTILEKIRGLFKF